MLASDAAEEETCTRLVHKEHGSAYSSLHSHATEYLQIIRVVHCSSRTGSPPSPRSRDSSKDVRLTVKVFSPNRLPRAGSISSEDDVAEAGYEDLTQLQTRVNDWLRQTGQSGVLQINAVNYCGLNKAMSSNFHL